MAKYVGKVKPQIVYANTGKDATSDDGMNQISLAPSLQTYDAKQAKLYDDKPVHQDDNIDSDSDGISDVQQRIIDNDEEAEKHKKLESSYQNGVHGSIASQYRAQILQKFNQIDDVNDAVHDALGHNASIDMCEDSATDPNVSITAYRHDVAKHYKRAVNTEAKKREIPRIDENGDGKVNQADVDEDEVWTPAMKALSRM